MSKVYSNLKIFKYSEVFEKLPAESSEIIPPLHIRVKPTNACNHNCWYCAYRAENLQLGKDMDVKQSIPRKKMLEFIDDCIEMGVKAITFSGGGEPFCYKYFDEVVKKLIGSGIKFAALTNGSLLKGEIAELFAHHASWLRISLDAWDDKSYAEYRSIKEGVFTQVLDNIANFKKLNGNCALGICYIIDKNNWKYIKDIADTMHELGVDSIKYAPCIVSNTSSETNEYHSALFEDAKKMIAEVKTKYSNSKMEIFDSYHEQLQTFEKTYSWCPFLQLNPVLGADENVYACHDKAYNLDEGVLCSIKDMRFKDAWAQNKEQFFKINPKKHCNHHCAANGKNLLTLDYLSINSDHVEFV